MRLGCHLEIKKKMCLEILQKKTAICFESKVHCFGESFQVQALSEDPPTLAMRYLKNHKRLSTSKP